MEEEAPLTAFGCEKDPAADGLADDDVLDTESLELRIHGEDNEGVNEDETESELNQVSGELFGRDNDGGDTRNRGSNRNKSWTRESSEMSEVTML